MVTGTRRCCLPIDVANMNVVHNVILLWSFFMAALMSAGLAGFCCAKLWMAKLDAEERGTYRSLLCCVVSVWLPSPAWLLGKTAGANPNNANANANGLARDLEMEGLRAAAAPIPPPATPPPDDGNA